MGKKVMRFNDYGMPPTFVKLTATVEDTDFLMVARYANEFCDGNNSRAVRQLLRAGAKALADKAQKGKGNAQ